MGGTLFPAQTDHVTSVLLRQSSPVAELLLRTRRQTLPSQRQQALQAVDQPLLVVAMAADAGLGLFQLSNRTAELSVGDQTSEDGSPCGGRRPAAAAPAR